MTAMGLLVGIGNAVAAGLFVGMIVLGILSLVSLFTRRRFRWAWFYCWRLYAASTSTPIDRSRGVRYGPERGTALTATVLDYSSGSGCSRLDPEVGRASADPGHRRKPSW